MANAYQNWSRSYARGVIQRELMDTSGKWWSDSELNLYISQWQDEVQQDFELVWGTCTLTTTSGTVALSSLTPPMARLDAIYWVGSNSGNGYRLAGRGVMDLERAHSEWRDATADTPREVIQYDSTSIIVWPPPSTPTALIFEYPEKLSFVADTSTIRLPIWTQWSLKPYACWRAYLRPGPINDRNKAMRYRVLYQRAQERIRRLWSNWLPERYRRLKPAGRYEQDILCPPPAIDAVRPSGIADTYGSYTPAGAVDGVNLTYTIPVTPQAIKVFLNGLLQADAGQDYTLNGATITFTAAPSSGDVVIVWAFRAA